MIFVGNVLKWKMILFRVWLNGLWFGTHNKVLNFNDWTLYYHKLFYDNRKKLKAMNLAMGLWHSNNMKVILRKLTKDHWFWTLWTLNYGDCIPFSCIDSFHMAHNQAKLFKEMLFSNFRKTWSNTSVFAEGVL